MLLPMIAVGFFVGISLFNWIAWFSKDEVKHPFLIFVLPIIVYAGIGYTESELMLYAMLGGAGFGGLTLIIFLLKNLFNR